MSKYKIGDIISYTPNDPNIEVDKLTITGYEIESRLTPNMHGSLSTKRYYFDSTNLFQMLEEHLLDFGIEHNLFKLLPAKTKKKLKYKDLIEQL